MKIARSVWFVILSLGLAGISYGLFLPSIARYFRASKTSNPPGLDSNDTILSVAIAFFSVGECAGAGLYSMLYRRYSMKTVWVFGYASAIIGNVLYTIPNIFSIIVGRTICGMWTGGMSAIARAYIVDTIPIEVHGLTRHYLFF